MFPNLADLAAIGQQINQFIVKTERSIELIIDAVYRIERQLEILSAKVNDIKENK